MQKNVHLMMASLNIIDVFRRRAFLWISLTCKILPSWILPCIMRTRWISCVAMTSRVFSEIIEQLCSKLQEQRARTIPPREKRKPRNTLLRQGSPRKERERTKGNIYYVKKRPTRADDDIYNLTRART